MSLDTKRAGKSEKSEQRAIRRNQIQVLYDLITDQTSPTHLDAIARQRLAVAIIDSVWFQELLKSQLVAGYEKGYATSERWWKRNAKESARDREQSNTAVNDHLLITDVLRRLENLEREADQRQDSQ